MPQFFIQICPIKVFIVGIRKLKKPAFGPEISHNLRGGTKGDEKLEIILMSLSKLFLAVILTLDVHMR